MNPACRIFCEQLADALRGRRNDADLAQLTWHEHLNECARCRDELEQEKALDALLATLPDPRLPAELATRVLRRLERDRSVAASEGTEARLDLWLERAGEVRVPPGLSDRVLSALRESHASEVDAADELDPLLELAGDVEVPSELGSEVLRGLRPHREVGAPQPRASWGGQRRVLQLAAGVLAAGLLGWIWWRSPAAPERTPEVATTDSETPDEGLLATLELLQSWDLLVDEDLDLQLAAIHPADELLLSPEEETEEAVRPPNKGG